MAERKSSATKYIWPALVVVLLLVAVYLIFSGQGEEEAVIVEETSKSRCVLGPEPDGVKVGIVEQETQANGGSHQIFNIGAFAFPGCSAVEMVTKDDFALGHGITRDRLAVDVLYLDKQETCG